MSDDQPDRLSEPGLPSPGEIAMRSKVIHRRAMEIGMILAAAKCPNNDVTACALIMMGASFLASPHSTIDPQYRDAIVHEMQTLGEAAAAVAQTKAATLAAQMRSRQRPERN